MNYAKSSEELQKDGTFRADRHENRLEDKVKILETIPDPPAHFDLKHRKKWAEVCRKVFDLGVLTENDLDSLETYVTYWFIQKDAADDVKKRGQNLVNEKGNEYRNPSLLTMSDATKILQQIAHKFAGNPQARMTIKTMKQDTKKADPLDALN